MAGDFQIGPQLQAFVTEASDRSVRKGHFKMSDDNLEVKSVVFSNSGSNNAKAAAKQCFGDALTQTFGEGHRVNDLIKFMVDPKMDDRDSLDFGKVKSFFKTVGLINTAGEVSADKLEKMRELASAAEALNAANGSVAIDNKLLASIVAGKKCFMHKINLNLNPIPVGDPAGFPADYPANLYVDLQQAIAEFIPTEEHRPAVDLTIKGSYGPESPTLGISGGTGPLSDAAMISKAMQRIPNGAKARIHVRLMSAPPHRGHKIFNPREISNYVARQASLCNSKPRFLSLASNTAHLNINSLGNMSKVFNPSWELDVERLLQQRELQPDANSVGAEIQLAATALYDAIELNSRTDLHDVVNDVVNFVRQDPNARPLILGTDQAFEKELYPNRFTAVGINTVGVAERRDPNVVQLRNDNGELNRDNLNNLTDQDFDHKTLQAFIDDTKQFGPNALVRDKLVDLIVDKLHAEAPNVPTHVVLGCTELPLLLHDGDREARELVIEKMRDRYPAIDIQDLEFIDTEEFFADRWSEMIISEVQGFDENNLEHRHYVMPN